MRFSLELPVYVDGQYKTAILDKTSLPGPLLGIRLHAAFACSLPSAFRLARGQNAKRAGCAWHPTPEDPSLLE